MSKEFFHDPIGVKSKRSSKDFAAPSKEQATTGRFMPAGDSYGVGHKQPVGRQGNPKQDVATLPRHTKCHEID